MSLGLPADDLLALLSAAPPPLVPARSVLTSFLAFRYILPRDFTRRVIARAEHRFLIPTFQGKPSLYRPVFDIDLNEPGT